MLDSLSSRGMDKMIQDAKGEVTITNDGATILNQMGVIHPAAKMLVELSKAQDIEVWQLMVFKLLLVHFWRTYILSATSPGR